MTDGSDPLRRAILLLVVVLVGAVPGSETAAHSPFRDSDLRAGTRVSVEGKLSPNRTILAEKIDLAPSGSDEELLGRIEAWDGASRSFRLLGFDVRLATDVQIARKPGEPAAVAELVEGMRVNVDGRRTADGVFVAKKVQIRSKQSGNETRLVGAIESIGGPGPGSGFLRILGIEVLIDERTMVARKGKRPRPALSKRLGGVNDDDPLLQRQFGRYSLAGEVRFQGEMLSNTDLDIGNAGPTDDDQLVPGISAIVGAGFHAGSVSAYAEIAGRRDFIVKSPTSFDEGTSDVYVREAYVEVAPLPWMSVAIGRQLFDDARDWYYHTRDLDAVRVLFDVHPLIVEASVSRAVFNQASNLDEQAQTNLILQAGYVVTDNLDLEGFYVDRRDRTGGENSRYIGARVLGDPGRHLRFWMDATHLGGSRSVDASGTEVVRRVDAWALDLGLTWRPRVVLDPHVTVGFAAATGERDDVRERIRDVVQDPALTPEEKRALLAPLYSSLARSDDATFRQTGLHRNRDDLHSLVSFRYYGELLDPELTNLRILTAGVGVRPRRDLSVDVVYHRYRQDEAVSNLVKTDLTEDPNGLSPDLGHELDLILGYEPSQKFELRVTAGRFAPGPAFDPDVPDGPKPATASVIRFRARFRF